jgi:ubiquinone/menaquinone biosynthesis C-methylase UbiE
MIRRLNIGCGRTIKKGFVNLDWKKIEGIDMVHNLNKYPWPFKDNSFDFVLAAHVLEHLDDPMRAMKELHRIVRERGVVEIHLPHFASISAYIDPTHKHFFSVNSFSYFTKEHSLDFYFDFKYAIISKKITFPKYFSILRPVFSYFANKFQGFYEANICYILRPEHIKIKLRVID